MADNQQSRLQYFMDATDPSKILEKAGVYAALDKNDEEEAKRLQATTSVKMYPWATVLQMYQTYIRGRSEMTTADTVQNMRQPQSTAEGARQAAVMQRTNLETQDAAREAQEAAKRIDFTIPSDAEIAAMSHDMLQSTKERIVRAIKSQWLYNTIGTDLGVQGAAPFGQQMAKLLTRPLNAGAMFFGIDGGDYDATEPGKILAGINWSYTDWTQKAAIALAKINTRIKNEITDLTQANTDAEAAAKLNGVADLYNTFLAKYKAATSPMVRVLSDRSGLAVQHLQNTFPQAIADFDTYITATLLPSDKLTELRTYGNMKIDGQTARYQRDFKVGT